MAGLVEEDFLSESDFKAKLYTSLQQKGILNSLKTQLRCLMVQQLQLPHSSSATGSSDNGGLPLQVANNVVASHLRSHGYEYTLSTFSPEADINLERPLSPKDLVRYLHLADAHPLSQLLETSSEGLLLPLLETVPELRPISHTHSTVTTTGVQTEEQCTEGCDREVGVADDVVGVATIEGRMLAFQRELENRNKRIMEGEIRRIKEKEASLIRMEEKNKYLKEISKNKEKLEVQYKNKMAATRKWLEEEKERLKRREADMEESLYTQRQVLLDEMELVKLRERELKRQTELNKRGVSLEQEKVRSLEEVLKSKDNLLEELKRQYTDMADTRVEHSSIELETRLCQEEQRRKQIEQDLQVEQQTSGDLRARYEDLKRDLERERGTSLSLQEALTAATSKQNELLKQLKDTPLSRQHQPTVMRSVPREEPWNGRGKGAELMQQTVSELEMRVEQLLQESEGKRREQDGLEQLLIKANQEKMALQYDNRQLRRETTIKVNECIRLQQACEQQTLVLRSTYQEIDDLQEQVDQLHQLLLVKHSPSGGGKEKRSTSGRRKRVSPVKQRSLLSDLSSPGSSPLPQPRPLLTNPSPPIASFSEASAVLLAEAKATFVRLDNEAKELQRNYSGYPSLPLSLSCTPPLSYITPCTTHAVSAPPTTITMATMSTTVTAPSTPTVVTMATIYTPITTTPPHTVTIATSPPTTDNSQSIIPVVTTPTQFIATPLLSTGQSHTVTNLVTHEVDPPLLPRQQYEQHGVSLDELWRTESLPNTKDDVTTSHVTANYEDLKREREERERLREERDRDEKERHARELLQLQREEREREERERRLEEEREKRIEEAEREREGTMEEEREEKLEEEERQAKGRGEEDVLQKYINLVQQQRSVGAHQQQPTTLPSTAIEDRASSFSLSTKSLTDSHKHNNSQETDTFEEW